MIINRLGNQQQRRSNGRRRSSSKREGTNHNLSSTVADRATTLIQSYPLTALGSAVVVGLAVGWWIKRR